MDTRYIDFFKEGYYANQQKRTHKRNADKSYAVQYCRADELIALAKTGGYELTKEEAESYMAELSDFELDHTALRTIAGGKCYIDCFGDDCSGRDL